jgi:hypothetical protein
LLGVAEKSWHVIEGQDETLVHRCSSIFFLPSKGPMGEKEDKLQAALAFIRRTGAHQIQVRYSDDEEPTIWFVVALFNKRGPTGVNAVEVDASVDPLHAALRLCERLADGGICAYCHRPAGFEPKMLNRMPFDNVICWYQYDPELKVFRRGCE